MKIATRKEKIDLMKNFFVFCTIVINLFTFLLCAYDKFAAKKGLFRIPEIVLLTFSFLLGSVGMLSGMCLFRHKTYRSGFVILVPLFLAIQVGIMLYFGFIDFAMPLE
jgi:uncharacterized membrane protein YsdA (DUF1294 family)